MWEIREGSGREREYGPDYRSGMRDKTKEAYECGYEDGYRDAIEELEGKTSHRMGERRRY